MASGDGGSGGVVQINGGVDPTSPSGVGGAGAGPGFLSTSGSNGADGTLDGYPGGGGGGGGGASGLTTGGNGGTGGDGEGNPDAVGGVGGAGGSGVGQDGGNGYDGVGDWPLGHGTGGGGGGGGGTAGNGATGTITTNATGGKGGNGGWGAAIHLSTGGGGGGGGTGGYGAVVETDGLTSSFILQGGAGGTGGGGGGSQNMDIVGGIGGSGGFGGVGVELAGGVVTTFTSSGTITGGEGGSGGIGGPTHGDYRIGGSGPPGAGGNGGDGAAGISITVGGVTVTNSGSIAGGAGGAGGDGALGNAPWRVNFGGDGGNGGTGIAGSGLTIINSGTISGGAGGAGGAGGGDYTFNGSGGANGNAITFAGGSNFLDLNPNGTQGTLNGNIAVTGSVTFAQHNAVTLNNIITGTGSVIQNGAGTLRLDAVNTYSGGTTLTAGTLGGTGTIGTLVVNGGTLAPGASAGIFHTGNVSFAAGATFAVQLGGTIAGVGGYDQLAVSGTVVLGGATLNLSLLSGFTPIGGNSFRIIDNNGTADAVTGTFAGHAEGSTFTSGGAVYAITYHGGDGNDVVLTVQSPPLAVRDDRTVTEDTAPNLFTGNVLANDSDPDGNALSVTSAGTFNLGHGTLVLQANGSYTYTLDNSNPAVDALNNGQTLVDNFTYGISDGHGGTASGTLAITIQGRTDNFPPVVAGAVILAAIAEDSGARLITQAQLLGNVTDVDGPSLTATDLVIATGSGTLVDNHDGTWSYTPDLNDDTSISFSYQVTDSFTSVADSATLDITPVNDAPTVAGAVTLAAIVEDSGARLITQAQLLGNVTDPDGPPLTATGLTIATGAGALVDNNDGTWSYTPALNDDTAVSFSYQVTDGVAAPVAGSATLDITAVNDMPVVTGAVTLLAIAEDSGARLITQAQLLGNVTDVDGPSLTATTLAITSGSGALVDNHDGTWNYTPALNDDTSVSFSYHVTDGAISVADSATLDITPVNDAPIVTGAVTLAAIAEDSGARLITQAQLLGNVTDLDGPSLAATAFAIATGSGSLVNNNNGTWSYTPAHDDDTAASFAWLVTDGTTSVADSGTLDITPVNDAPVNALPATRFIVPNADVAVTGLAVNDVDSTSLTTTLHVEHGTLNVGAVGGATVVGSGSATVTLTGSAAQIDAALGAANNVLYHSVFNFAGIDHLTMTSNDGSLGDTDVLNLSVFEQVQAQTVGGITRPTLTLDATGHIILDQAAADFAATYGSKALYLGMPESTPYPPVAAHDFHLI